MKRLVILITIAALILASCDIQPDACFYSDRVTAEVGEEIFFTNTSFNFYRCEWDFGDGTWSDSYNPVHSWPGSGLFTVTLTVWSSTGCVDKAFQNIEIYSPTMLEIEVLEYYDEYPVSGASVILYPTLKDWDNETNALVEGFTNSTGKVIFTNLCPCVYYVDVWHPTHNNYTLRNEDAGFIMTDKINAHELNQFIAWVDYTGTKIGSSTRDRKMVVTPKNRDIGTKAR